MTPDATARAVILARIRAAQDGVERPAPAPGPQRPSPGAAVQDPVAHFLDRAADHGAGVHRVAPDGVAGLLERLCRARGARRVGIPAGLDRGWLPPGVELVVDGQRSAPLAAAALDALDGAITGCALAIAETGTVVLDGGVGQGRRALSLVPDWHCCLVRADDVVPDVPDAIERLAPAAAAGRPLTLISGPSATSDIELDRVVGVHGPRRLDLVVVG